MSEQQCPGCGSLEHSDCCGAGIEAGEICLFPNMPWIHEKQGSLLETELIEKHYTKPGGLSKEEWDKKLELRIAIGKHDLRRRNFD